MKSLKKLPRAFYNRDTTIVAQELLGKYLVHHKNGVKYIGKIVETEAYVGPHDMAAHSCRGLTPRTKAMFGPPGHAYVYLIYGIYHCMNIVTEPEGHGSGVLLRAIEPVKNIDQRTQGPGLLTRAMQIDKSLYAHDMLSDNFYVAELKNQQPANIIKRPRIGVHYAGEWAEKLLRFYIEGNSYISKR